jgi:hypothetical protein
VVGAILFFVGVNLGMESEATEAILTLIANIAFLIALAPIGLRYLAGDSQAYELGMTAA